VLVMRMVCLPAFFGNGVVTMFGQIAERQREPGDVVFHPMRAEEYNIPRNFGNLPQQYGARPEYMDFLCGDCGKTTHARVVCDLIRGDGSSVYWCLCPCQSPTVIVRAKTGERTMHLPHPKEFMSDAKWPEPLRMLYDEAALAYAGSAFTAAAMLCRKALMCCTCHEQTQRQVPVEEGKTFAYYVDYLASNVLTFPAAKTPLHAIRDIGNDANHHVQFVAKPEAERAMNIVRHLFNTIYSFTAA
jgi:hypothetical protein